MTSLCYGKFFPGTLCVQLAPSNINGFTKNPFFVLNISFISFHFQLTILNFYVHTLYTTHILLELFDLTFNSSMYWYMYGENTL